MSTWDVEDVEPPVTKVKTARPTLKGIAADLPIGAAATHSTETEYARIQRCLDSISEKVDACLTELKGEFGHQRAAKTTHASHNPKGESLFAIVPGSGPPQTDSSLADSVTSLRQQMVPFNARQATVAWCEEVSDGEDREVRREDDDARIRRRTNHRARTMDLKLAKEIFGEKEKRMTKPLLRLIYRNRCDSVWELLDDPESSRAAWWISQTLKVLVIISILVTNLQVTLEPTLQGGLATFLEMSFDIIFLIEFLCRILSAPSKKEYLRNPLNWADMLSALGLPLRLSSPAAIESNAIHVGDPVHVTLLFLLPIVRLLKLLRYFENIRLLIDAFRNSVEALPVLMYTLALIVMVASTFLYLIETRSAVPSLQHSLWLCVVTMTTVGYGDFVPTSTGGYLLVSGLVIVSVLFVAMPVGIIGQEFNNSWQGRDRVLCITRAQQAMAKWGYTAADVKVLFEYVDEDHDGNLDLLEFIELMRQMRIGLSVERSIGLFMLFDDNQNGSINYMEFMRHVFPREFVEEAKKDVQNMRSSAKVQDALEALTASRGGDKGGSCE
mmetsp:Transcript_18420/g.43093  ORF Transcript_18420/g.43093 Transcript_18420/m.43093 type:complete len:555 (-) Transcript_18420:113-1777(-)